MNDTPFDCECPLCRERLEKSGGTGNVLRFVNRMARAAAKVYPDILVETLAYWTYMELPKDDTVDVDDLSEESNSMLYLTRGGFVPHISGFAQVLGTEKVSIWARIKFSGAAYGGSPDKADAIWFDRLFFVP